MKSHFFGAMLLVAGTCIGGGMLALPVDTAEAGFFPSLIGMALSWMFMTITALFLLEANLWMEEGTHYLTMASRLLGRPGKYLSLVLFLLIGYLSLVAYNTGGATLIKGVFPNTIFASHNTACILYALIFGSMFYMGTVFLGRINAILVTGMIAAYAGLIFLGVTKVDFSLVQRTNMQKIFPAFPILLTIFSFQMIVPSLVPYLHRDLRQLKKAILLGTTIPFFIYLLWQWVILGTVPLKGEVSLQTALQEGTAATEQLRQITHHRFLSIFADFFAFFAITTSYLGIGLGLFDFLADALKMAKKGWRKALLGLYVIVPALFIALLFPKVFILFLEMSGGFGDAMINGLIPAVMVYAGRYIKKYEGPYQIKGGKPLIAAIGLYALCVIVIQIINMF